ncbi:MAG: hypothetical protein K0U74_13635 [Alphaproteobacteria bacterium]|nr:hypothetical protein [Alphaproteobacteria bacterium]
MDLETVRETLLYMHNDLRSVPGMEAIAHSLGQALREIDATASISKQRTARHLTSHTPARFFPAR